MDVSKSRAPFFPMLLLVAAIPTCIVLVLSLAPLARCWACEGSGQGVGVPADNVGVMVWRCLECKGDGRIPPFAKWSSDRKIVIPDTGLRRLMKHPRAGAEPESR